MYNPHTVLTREALEAQVREAVKAGDDVTKRALRPVVSAWQWEEIAQGEPLSQQQALKLIQREVNARRETIQDAEMAGRQARWSGRC